MQWESNIDGPLGSGATLSLSNLSSGQHVVTLTATDDIGNTATKEVTITVSEVPEFSYNTFGLSTLNVGGYGTNSLGDSIELDMLAPNFSFMESGTLNGNTFTSNFDTLGDTHHVVGTATFTFDPAFETITSFDFDGSTEYGSYKVTLKLSGTNVPFKIEHTVREYELFDHDVLDSLSKFYWRKDSNGGQGWTELTAPRANPAGSPRLKIFFTNN